MSEPACVAAVDNGAKSIAPAGIAGKIANAQSAAAPISMKRFIGILPWPQLRGAGQCSGLQKVPSNDFERAREPS
jgi:hypothetical protein